MSLMLAALLKKGWTKFVDPDREERIGRCAARLNRYMAEHRNDFDRRRALASCDCNEEDAEAVCERVYALCVNRAWKDLDLSDKESRTLEWIALSLQLPEAAAAAVRADAGREVFANLLAQAIADGTVDPDEFRHLTAIAQWCRATVRELVQQFFSDTGEAFLRGVFTAAAEDGQILQHEWQNFLESAERLGFTQIEAKRLVQPFAQQFVEHVLADAKADDSLSEAEERSLLWMLDQFTLSREFRDYVTTVLSEFRLMTDVQEGRLPTIDGCRAIELRAGEIVHNHGPAVYMREKQRKNGIVNETYSGTLTITDDRAVFLSPEKSFSLNHGAIIAFEPLHSGVAVRTGSKGTGTYQFGGNATLASAIWKTAIGRANQTIVQRRAEPPTRHIPRDVRQRIWQRYGGRCAECQSEQYLEFDHIVPVARGGSNSDNNVQLLCRGCNLKKSDTI